MSITKTRQKLIEVARELFARKGIEGTTMNDIATTSQKGGARSTPISETKRKFSRPSSKTNSNISLRKWTKW